MFHFYNILIFNLFFTYSLSNEIHHPYPNRTITSSRSIYDLVQMRRAAARLVAYYNRTHRNQPTNHFLHPITPESKTTNSNNKQRRYLMERLQTIIIISSITLGFLTVIVIICIISRYCQGKNSIPTERIEQRKALNPARGTYIYTESSQRNNERRKFSRKSRPLPTAV